MKRAARQKTGPRIVSLMASSTEIVCALGFEDSLVGRSHECDFPASVLPLPVVTKPLFEICGTSAEIDQSLRETLAESQSVYKVDEELLQSLRPTHIITQAQCEVCAVSLKDVERALGALKGPPPRVVKLSPDSLKDVFEDIARVAAALGAKERGRKLIDGLLNRMAAVEGRARGLFGPTIAVVEWIDPLMTAGNWTPELVAMAGGKNLFGEAGKHSTSLTFNDFIAKDAEVVLVAPCGFDIERIRPEMPALTRKPEWPRLRAVRSRRVYLGDGSALFNRPGPRVVESLEVLAEVLHPESFPPVHQGKGWERFEG